MDAESIGGWIGAIGIGVLCGLIPLKLGKKYQCEGWGLGGLIASIIGGVTLGMILAIPLSAIFSVIILVSKREGDVPPT